MGIDKIKKTADKKADMLGLMNHYWREYTEIGHTSTQKKKRVVTTCSKHKTYRYYQVSKSIRAG